MKKVIIILMIFITVYTFADSDKFAFGLTVIAGGRYDNLRMCVASPAGIKGGPIADIFLNFTFIVEEDFNIAIKLPVMRPILFAAAFKMLQFEPEVDFIFKKPINDNLKFIGSVGAGISFHYGPDYTSDKDNRGDSFFAVGPMLTGNAGFGFGNRKEQMLTLKAFYIPLFSKDYDTGTVIGGALDYTILF
jgi:hypothetical protein